MENIFKKKTCYLGGRGLNSKVTFPCDQSKSFSVACCFAGSQRLQTMTHTAVFVLGFGQYSDSIPRGTFAFWALSSVWDTSRQKTWAINTEGRRLSKVGLMSVCPSPRSSCYEICIRLALFALGKSLQTNSGRGTPSDSRSHGMVQSPLLKFLSSQAQHINCHSYTSWVSVI